MKVSMAIIPFKYVIFVWKQLHLFLIRKYYWDQCWFYDSTIWDLGEPIEAIDKNKWIIQGILFVNLCVCVIVFCPCCKVFLDGNISLVGVKKMIWGKGGQVQVFVFLSSSLRLITLIGILLSIERKSFYLPITEKLHSFS